MKYSFFTRDDDYSRNLKIRICDQLQQLDGFALNEDDPELVICIGGDGTLLRAIHHYQSQLDHILFTAIHTGTLGFFTDYTKNEVDEFLHDLQHEPIQIDNCELLEAQTDDGQIYYAMNEVRIGSFTTTVCYDIFIDDEYLETTRSCGICISTQAGSTAANRALGGAVVDDDLKILELTQIMPVSHINQHSLTSPYILKQERVIDIKGKSLENSVLCYDHLETGKLIGIENVKIRLSDKKVRMARFRPYSYLKRLKNLY